MGLLRLNCGAGEAAKFSLNLPREMQFVDLLRLAICGAGEADHLWDCCGWKFMGFSLS